MSTVIGAAKKLELQNQAYLADELIRMAIGVARRYEATHPPDVEKLDKPKPIPTLDLNEVKQLANNYYGDN